MRFLRSAGVTALFLLFVTSLSCVRSAYAFPVGGSTTLAHSDPVFEAVAPDIAELLEQDLGRPDSMDMTWQCPPGREPWVVPGTEKQLCIGPSLNEKDKFSICTRVGNQTFCVDVSITCSSDGKCKLDIGAPFNIDCKITQGDGSGVYRVNCPKTLFTDPICVEYHFEGSGSSSQICFRDCGQDQSKWHCIPLQNLPQRDKILPTVPGYCVPPSTSPDGEWEDFLVGPDLRSLRGDACPSSLA